MGTFRIRTGYAVIKGKDGGRSLIDEEGRETLFSHPASEIIDLIQQGVVNEDALVAALMESFSPDRLYYSLIQLQKAGIVVADRAAPESPADLFRARLTGDSDSIPAMTIKILFMGGAERPAAALAASLSRSGALSVEGVGKGGMAGEYDTNAIYVAVTPDYLEPELEAFGRLALKKGVRWLPVKPQGIIPWMGPLFIPGETGCIACLLDRVKGHRRAEAEEIRLRGGKESLRLSVGHTAYSLDTIAGLLATELEKTAAGGASPMGGALFTFDFRSLQLTRHALTRRPQCPLCGTFPPGDTAVPEGPLRLGSRKKAEYRDGGERVCAAIETLEKYAPLISPITGVVGRLAAVEGIPACFGTVVRGDWIVRGRSHGAAMSRNGRLSPTGISSGKGRSLPQAQASALGEAIERYCSQYEGYEPCIGAPFTDLGDEAIHPHDLMGFSERQYREREAWRRKGETAYVPDPYDDARPIDWTAAWSLTQGRRRLIPSAYAYYSYPVEGGGDICPGCSNGVAAGNCLEEATMQGFFELVERDAVAIWWYHKLLKPAVDWRGFDSPYTAQVDRAMEEKGMVLEVLDLTHDLAIPVFAANLFDRNKGYCFRSIGLGAHHDPRIALERAIAELGQSWRMADRDEGSIRFQESPHSREPFLRADPDQVPKKLSDFIVHKSDDFLDEITRAVRMLETRGLEMVVMDLTRPDVGFPVARVIVPGLIHFWPRFGCRRLFEVPLRAGWIDEDKGEDDLNPVPFYL
ncbi:MAG TPA: TOMM precursor leader peptide-binding protein [Syntrophorhabdaceae bacterium]|jgi:ribosomal protein S12 methylthiotransferase accessory factor